MLKEHAEAQWKTVEGFAVGAPFFGGIFHPKKKEILVEHLESKGEDSDSDSDEDSEGDSHEHHHSISHEHDGGDDVFVAVVGVENHDGVGGYGHDGDHEHGHDRDHDHGHDGDDHGHDGDHDHGHDGDDHGQDGDHDHGHDGFVPAEPVAVVGAEGYDHDGAEGGTGIGY